ncbi:MAG: hypothetical protein QXF01_01010 [Candidatus Micrarchaeaceae archaeon]
MPKVQPLAFECTSTQSLEDLVEKAKAVSTGDNFVLLIDNKEDAIGRILPAYLNSYIKHKEGNMRSESLQIEMLLFLAGTFKISKAIERYGAKRSSNFLLIGNKVELLRSFAKNNGIKLVRKLKLGISEKFMPEIEK